MPGPLTFRGAFKGSDETEEPGCVPALEMCNLYVTLPPSFTPEEREGAFLSPGLSVRITRKSRLERSALLPSRPALACRCTCTHPLHHHLSVKGRDGPPHPSFMLLMGSGTRPPRSRADVMLMALRRSGCHTFFTAPRKSPRTSLASISSTFMFLM